MPNGEGCRAQQIAEFEPRQRRVEERVIAGLAEWDSVPVAVLKKPWVMVVGSHFALPGSPGVDELYHGETCAVNPRKGSESHARVNLLGVSGLTPYNGMNEACNKANVSGLTQALLHTGFMVLDSVKRLTHYNGMNEICNEVNVSGLTQALLHIGFIALDSVKRLTWSNNMAEGEGCTLVGA